MQLLVGSSTGRICHLWGCYHILKMFNSKYILWGMFFYWIFNFMYIYTDFFTHSDHGNFINTMFTMLLEVYHCKLPFDSINNWVRAPAQSRQSSSLFARGTQLASLHVESGNSWITVKKLKIAFYSLVQILCDIIQVSTQQLLDILQYSVGLG